MVDNHAMSANGFFEVVDMNGISHNLVRIVDPHSGDGSNFKIEWNTLKNNLS